MYSRNISLDNSAYGMRPPSNIKNEKTRERIPVKSFSDSFAYERFNKMGNSADISEKAADKNEVATRLTAEKTMFPEEAEIQSEASAVTDAKQDRTPKAENSPFSFLSRIRELIDSDTVFILLAAIMILFSENATNDKLTPLALLAILFL